MFRTIDIAAKALFVMRYINMQTHKTKEHRHHIINKTSTLQGIMVLTSQ